MASINTIVKRKQYLWLGIVVVGAASAIGGALYLSDVDMSGNGETVAEQEPVPDMTGVVDTTFDDKVRQHATTEMQVTAAQMQKQYEEIRRELDVLNKQRGYDQRRIEKLGQDNAALAEQVKALGANPVTATGEPVPQTPASPPGPEGEPQPGNTPVSFPPQGSVAVPPPTAFYPGNGVTPPPQVTYQSVPVPNRIQRKVFTRNEGKQGPSLPYIPSGSFAKAMLIEGADANASVTGNESTVPMQLRITGLVEMPNSKTYDATGCFVGLEAWGDVSSERAIVRTRNISCLKDGKTIDMPIIRNVLLPSFANAFTEAGFATITFDYRGFGESEGERGRLVPAMQTEDIISVINWAEKQVCIDNQRIGLWGTSLGGCHVFNAAAQDKRVKSIVSQLAFADGEVLVTGEMNELEKASFLSTLNKMAEKKKNTGKEMFVGVTRVLSDNESKVFFEKVKGQYPEMDIKIPFLTVMETLQYKPAESAAKVQCPVLVVIAGQDSVNPPEQGRALYDAVASGTKELYEEADACHYDIYEGAFFERVAAVQTQWFKKHL